MKQLYQAFWKRWASDYPGTLMFCSKRSKPAPTLAVGDVAFVIGLSFNSTNWPMKKFTELFPLLLIVNDLELNLWFVSKECTYSLRTDEIFSLEFHGTEFELNGTPSRWLANVVPSASSQLEPHSPAICSVSRSIRTLSRETPTRKSRRSSNYT